MTKGRKLKNKLQRITTATPSRLSETQHGIESELHASQVNAQLEKLRAEQLRAKRNQLLRQGGFTITHDTDPWQLSQKRAEVRVAGPPPPPSWLAMSSQAKEPPGPCQRAVPARRPTVPSLAVYCAQKLAHHVTLITQQDDPVIAIPAPVRQLLLRYCTVTDDILEALRASDYSELPLEGASITFDRFLYCFWRIDAIQTRKDIQEKEDWEDEDEEEVELDEQVGYTYHPENEHDLVWPMKDLFHMLQPRFDLNRSYRLSTPLAEKLVSLNLSFIRPWMPTTALAHLIATTLPDLMSLSLAGTLKAAEGPQAISLLSHSLKKLVYWDLGYHSWLEPHILCGQVPQCAIRWEKSLLYLKTLCLHQCGTMDGTGQAVSSWLRSQSKNDPSMRHVRTLRVLWDESTEESSLPTRIG